MQPNKAIVGRNAFSHESGIHQDGVLKNPSTFEIMDPRKVGLDDSNQIVLGKLSGRAALRDALEKMGYELSGDQLVAAFKRFKVIADRKKQVTAMDLEALVTDDLRTIGASGFELVSFDVHSTSEGEPSSTVTITLPDGAERSGQGTGDGTVDSVFDAINHAAGVEARCASTASMPSARARTRSATSRSCSSSARSRCAALPPAGRHRWWPHDRSGLGRRHRRDHRLGAAYLRGLAAALRAAEVGDEVAAAEPMR